MDALLDKLSDKFKAQHPDAEKGTIELIKKAVAIFDSPLIIKDVDLMKYRASFSSALVPGHTTKQRQRRKAQQIP